MAKFVYGLRREEERKFDAPHLPTPPPDQMNILKKPRSAADPWRKWAIERREKPVLQCSFTIYTSFLRKGGRERGKLNFRSESNLGMNEVAHRGELGKMLKV